MILKCSECGCTKFVFVDSHWCDGRHISIYQCWGSNEGIPCGTKMVIEGPRSHLRIEEVEVSGDERVL
jgi:hypothetical protein